MDAIVTAGGQTRPEDPLFPYTQGGHKALMDVDGKPMAQWMLDALGGSAKVDRVVLTGLPESCGLTCAKPLTFVPDQGSMLDNLEAGTKELLKVNPQHRQVLAVSSDVPGVKTEMIDWLIETIQKTDLDIYYNIIPREVMEKRYPGSRRTFTHVKGAVFTGGDVNAINTRVFSAESPLWGKIIEARKSPIKQAGLVGFDIVFLLLIRQITLEWAVKNITKRLGVTGQAIICPYAEMGMDIDKPHQLEMMRADLNRQLTSPKS
jgi:molybdopterin-guanine dinucleotide biosynthesis protein A